MSLASPSPSTSRVRRQVGFPLVMAEPPRSSHAPLRWLGTVVPALLLFFLPIGEFSPPQRHLLAIFVGTVIGLALRPAPSGMITLLSLIAAMVTRTLSAEEALAGFGNPTVWLIFSAFVFAQAASHTQLGLRIAYFFIQRMARTSLTLGYATSLTNLVLAPFLPSDVSRGGVIAPIVRSVAQVLGSDPGPTANRIGSYLTLVAFHSNYVASAMFLTSMVGNPLVAKFALDVAHVELSWGRWALAAIVPGLATITLVPWLLHHLSPPYLSETANAQTFARNQLRNMGPVTRGQGLLLLILVGVLAGWLTTPWHGVGNTVIAMAGVGALLLGKVLSWEDLVNNAQAWGVLVWFAPLLMMSNQLSQQGVLSVVFGATFRHFSEWPWTVTLVAITVVYLYAHYAFASLTAHISALYAGFLAVAISLGVPGPLAAWTLAFFSSLNAGITHYSVASAPLYFANGYVSQSQWWSIGFIVSVVNLAIWLGLGPPWWRLLGLW